MARKPSGLRLSDRIWLTSSSSYDEDSQIMTTQQPTLASRRTRIWLYTLLALVIPGSGQYLLGKRWRGILLFISIPILGYITYWAQTDQNIGLVTLGAFKPSWLWLPFGLFWAWNVLDACRLAAGRPSNPLVEIFLALVILYVVAWNVTQIEPARLVTRLMMRSRWRPTRLIRI